MISGIMAAVSGMRVASRRVSQSAHNLANLSTPGFTPGRVEQADMAQGGATVSAVSRTASSGALVQTGQPLDMAIDGGGFFVLNDDQGGQLYTRAGVFMLDNNGRVVDSMGRSLNPAVKVPAGAQSVSVSPQGVFQALGANGEVLAEAQIETASFGNPGGLQPVGGNAFKATQASGPAVTAAPGTPGHGFLVPGALQASGNDMLTETINLITGQRSFEANIKSLQTQDEMLGTVLDVVG